MQIPFYQTLISLPIYMCRTYRRHDNICGKFICACLTANCRFRPVLISGISCFWSKNVVSRACGRHPKNHKSPFFACFSHLFEAIVLTTAYSRTLMFIRFSDPRYPFFCDCFQRRKTRLFSLCIIISRIANQWYTIHAVLSSPSGKKSMDFWVMCSAFSGVQRLLCEAQNKR